MKVALQSLSVEALILICGMLVLSKHFLLLLCEGPYGSSAPLLPPGDHVVIGAMRNTDGDPVYHAQMRYYYFYSGRATRESRMSFYG